MSEMIEQVAKAIRFKIEGVEMDGFVMMDDYRGEVIGDWRDVARAAIEAMRQPTESMIGTSIPGLRAEIVATYQDMINAALAVSGDRRPDAANSVVD